MCNAHKEDFYDIDNVTPTATTWRHNQEHEYCVACDRCEVKVTILNAEQHQLLKDLLYYDRRKRGRGQLKFAHRPQ